MLPINSTFYSRIKDFRSKNIKRKRFKDSKIELLFVSGLLFQTTVN